MTVQPLSDTQSKVKSIHHDVSTLLQIAVPPAESASTVELLHLMDDVLREWDTEEYFVRQIHAGDQSVRLINARRFEVFVIFEHSCQTYDLTNIEPQQNKYTLIERTKLSCVSF